MASKKIKSVSSSNGHSVTLLRTATIKAIITEDFKKYLVVELQDEIKDIHTQIQQLDQNFESLKTNPQVPPERLKQIEVEIQVEKEKRTRQIITLKSRLEEAKTLPLETLFNQGTIQGLVTVKEGDNLYHKLASMELIVKDGIVQKIKTID